MVATPDNTAWCCRLAYSPGMGRLSPIGVGPSGLDSPGSRVAAKGGAGAS